MGRVIGKKKDILLQTMLCSHVIWSLFLGDNGGSIFYKKKHITKQSKQTNRRIKQLLNSVWKILLFCQSLLNHLPLPLALAYNIDCSQKVSVTVKYIATPFEIVEPVKHNLLGCDAGAVVCGLTTAAKASSSLRPLSTSWRRLWPQDCITSKVRICINILLLLVLIKVQYLIHWKVLLSKKLLCY